MVDPVRLRQRALRQRGLQRAGPGALAGELSGSRNVRITTNLEPLHHSENRTGDAETEAKKGDLGTRPPSDPGARDGH